MNFRKLVGVTAVSAAVAGLAACGGSSDPRPTADLRIVHAATDAPDVRVNLQNDGIDDTATTRLDRIGYGASSAFLRVRPSRYAVTVDALLPEGDSLDGVVDEILLFERDKQFTIVATGLISDGSFEPLIIETERAPVSAGQSRIQVVHAAASAPMVDIYLAAVNPVLPPEDDDGDDEGDQGDVQPQGLAVPDEEFNCTEGEPTIAGVSFRDFTDRLEVMPGDYQICVTSAGMNDAVFRSGIVGLSSGDDLLVSAIDNAGARFDDEDNSPINLLVSFPNASSTLLLRDLDDRAGVDVVHAASGVGPAEVYFTLQSDFVACAPDEDDNGDNGGIQAPAPLIAENGDENSVACTDPVVPSIAFNDDLRAAFAAGSYALRVNAEGAGSEDAPIAANNLAVSQGSAYIAVAAGHILGSDANLFPLFLERQTRAIATEARLRLIHAASLSRSVGVFITEAGEVTQADIEFARVSPTFTLAVGQDTGYFNLAEGEYDIRIGRPFAEGGFDVIFSDTGFIDNGSIQDLIIRNQDENEGLAFPDLIDIFTAINNPLR